jgi:hypothetical protein
MMRRFIAVCGLVVVWAVGVGALAGSAVASPRGYAIVTNGGVALAGSWGEGFADCPKGTVTYGGGVSVDSTSPVMGLDADTPRIDGLEWHAWVDNPSSSSVSYTDYAVCAKKNTSWNIQFGSVANPNGLVSPQVYAYCSTGELLGGGAYGSWAGRALGQTVDATYPVPGGLQPWGSQMNNNSGFDGTADSVAICGHAKGVRFVHTKHVSALPGVQTSTTVWCPVGKVPLSGGDYNSDFSLAFNLVDSYPTSNATQAGWTVTMANNGPLPEPFYIYAMCAS